MNLPRMWFHSRIRAKRRKTMPFNGRALTATSFGLVLIWSGVKGWSVLATIGDLVTGKKPSQPVTVPLQIAGGDSGETGGVSTTTGTSGLAAIANQYLGHAYIFGAAPGEDGKRPWDCSSMVNWIVSVKAGKAIPGYGPGKYRGNVHGPPTGLWAVWNGMDTVKRSDVQAGDILVWPGHMGIAASNSHVISALNPKDTTKVTPIANTADGPLIRIGRLR